MMTQEDAGQKYTMSSGWYIVLNPIELGGHHLHPGDVVKYEQERWHVDGGEGILCNAPMADLCRIPATGIPVYQIRGSATALLESRRIGGDGSWEVVSRDLVLNPPQSGQSHLYVLFGNRFFRIEMFRD